ncbi:hypothetical protein COU62_02490 [Candidatus Pacearchaeota archaeon CG10_big_fil_rev_8_21_14_0_10_35_219]|nr:MAG: hypothetical protein AUJ63_00510 [Candidatus Pacearchaeota archaeon CG1_02_35_32]PIO07710.1 MAG: hypothetical protein COU62_02490 [Candidatus Pacearchaeota archaeon CG10_big_fil_rev_8_21_14_0_10_35_219]PIY81509.1 MAG: hypothetical protein COY79_02090 [Candidatus Pacearchaeota archaeon CG_4_10_14_0_8_um_filter_35_169]PIZ80405.1 MAG: hypothetical protein COY00_01025 [Candidatus Pacearchaeota archaeon CG_4_10_14_0_2_um_filter_35_33]PJA69685.1 MAG: hypothetical protein CO155_03785 [Candidat
MTPLNVLLKKETKRLKPPLVLQTFSLHTVEFISNPKTLLFSIEELPHPAYFRYYKQNQYNKSSMVKSKSSCVFELLDAQETLT